MANIGKRVFDWARIAAALPPAARAEFNVLRSSYLSVANDLESTSKEAAPIDWASYKATISDPTFLDMIKTTYEGLEYKYPADADTPVIKAAQASLEKRAAEAVAAANADIAALEAQLSAIENEKPLDAITAKEYLKDHPEWRKKFKKENENFEYM